MDKSNATVMAVIRNHRSIDDNNYDLLTVNLDDGETVEDYSKDFDAGLINVGDRVEVRKVKMFRKIQRPIIRITDGN